MDYTVGWKKVYFVLENDKKRVVEILKIEKHRGLKAWNHALKGDIACFAGVEALR